MRVCSIVLATAVALLATSDAVFAAPETKAAAIATAGAPQSVAIDTRVLRTEGTAADALSADDEEREADGFWEKTKFLYWYKMGDTPAELYLKWFEGVDRAIVVKNPNYAVWKRYKAYYDKKIKSK
jgi:hypothetical protein